MKISLTFFLLILLSMPSLAEVLVGTGTLTYIKDSQYQAEPCEKCVELFFYRNYAIKDFHDLSGKKHKSMRTILLSHSTNRRGSFFFVLQKFSTEDSAKYEAEFKIIDFGPIVKSFCLDKEIQSYEPTLNAKYSKIEPDQFNNARYCYAVGDLRVEQ